MRAGPTYLAAEGRGGCAFRLMWDGPRGEQGCSLGLLAPPGSVLPARIPLKSGSRVGAGRFGGGWGRRGGRMG
jgi:hypothetical protein